MSVFLHISCLWCGYMEVTTVNEDYWFCPCCDHQYIDCNEEEWRKET